MIGAAGRSAGGPGHGPSSRFQRPELGSLTTAPCTLATPSLRQPIPQKSPKGSCCSRRSGEGETPRRLLHYTPARVQEPPRVLDRRGGHLVRRPNTTWTQGLFSHPTATELPRQSPIRVNRRLINSTHRRLCGLRQTVAGLGVPRVVDDYRISVSTSYPAAIKIIRADPDPF